MDTLARFNVTVSGQADGQPMVFAHGFGCDQHMWRLVAPRFESDYRVVLFDYIGFGGPTALPTTLHDIRRCLATPTMSWSCAMSST